MRRSLIQVCLTNLLGSKTLGSSSRCAGRRQISRARRYSFAHDISPTRAATPMGRDKPRPGAPFLLVLFEARVEVCLANFRGETFPPLCGSAIRLAQPTIRASKFVKTKSYSCEISQSRMTSRICFFRRTSRRAIRRTSNPWGKDSAWITLPRLEPSRESDRRE